MAEEGTAAAQEAAAQQQFVTQRIYTKDVSFESPMTPNVFGKSGSLPSMWISIPRAAVSTRKVTTKLS